MRAAYLFGAGDVRMIDAPDPQLLRPTDAIVRVVRSCVCGSDLHPYHNLPATPEGASMGHEFIGIVEEAGTEVTTLSVGDFVIAPFAWSDGTCQFCRDGLQTACENGGFWNDPGKQTYGGQAEAVRVPLADGTLVKVPAEVDEALYPSLLTLSDVYGTGWHATVAAQVQLGGTVTVVGDGAVGLMAVLSAKQQGADRIILMGRHTDRTDLGVEFGATDVVAERGDEGIARVLDLTGGAGTHSVVEAVGHEGAYEQAIKIVRAGGMIGRVGVPQFRGTPAGFHRLFWKNAGLTGGPAPARAYIEPLLPAILDGSVNPGRVFDRTVPLEQVPEAYRAMDDRSALKVLVAV